MGVIKLGPKSGARPARQQIVQPEPVERVVEVIKEVKVEVPVEVIKYVDRPVEVIKEVVKEVVKVVERPVEVIKEVKVEVPVDREVIHQTIKEVPVYYTEEKIVKVRVVDTEYKVPVIAKVAMVMAVVESMVLLAMFLK
jgi:hypothetical protein